MNGFPLVSCVMPTADRPRFAALALTCFAAQDYPNLEMIVVEQSREPVGGPPPREPRVRWLQQPVGTQLAELRNVACREAAGAIIVHWDDDDWSAPWRVSAQVRGLVESGADVCGTRRAYYLDLRDGTTWEYVYPDGRRPYVVDNTLCYRRDLWLRAPFPSGVADPELRFQWDDPGLDIHVLAGHDVLVGTIHRSNTSPKKLSGPRWQRCASGTVRTLMGPAWDDYLCLGDRT